MNDSAAESHSVISVKYAEDLKRFVVLGNIHCTEYYSPLGNILAKVLVITLQFDI